MAEISVIIPVYNSINYIKRCIESIINQSFSDLEIICVDDCSTDKSATLLKEYAERDSRIKVIINEDNLKAAGTRNVGLENATGKYVYFIDDDDYIDADYLLQMHEKIQTTGAYIVMNTNVVTETNGKQAQYIHPSMPDIPDEGIVLDKVTAIDKSFCAVWMRLFRRDFIEKNHIRFQRVNMTEDNVFHYVTNVHATKIFAFHGTAAYHYVIREDSITGIAKANNQRDLLTMKAYDLIYDYLSDKHLLEDNKAKLYNVSAFYKVDTEEKYDFYKSYFKKIESVLEQSKEVYTEIDLFFAECILKTTDFEDYQNKYPASLAIAFLKRNSN